jgi:hypothetical protein
MREANRQIEAARGQRSNESRRGETKRGLGMRIARSSADRRLEVCIQTLIAHAAF